MPEQLDQQLFLFLNSLNSPFMDKVMYVITAKLTWVPLYVLLLCFFQKKLGRKFWLFLIFIALSVLLADRGSVLIKNTVDRLRPCHEPALTGEVHLIGERCGGNYGFVSSHASNAFNVALLSLLVIRRRWYTISIVFWALIVGYSRIYAGVHYPGDVICGSLYGALIGWGMYRLFIHAGDRLLKPGSWFLNE
jgi:undecaprenyl-diphosphatase